MEEHFHHCLQNEHLERHYQLLITLYQVELEEVQEPVEYYLMLDLWLHDQEEGVEMVLPMI